MDILNLFNLICTFITNIMKNKRKPYHPHEQFTLTCNRLLLKFSSIWNEFLFVKWHDEIMKWWSVSITYMVHMNWFAQSSISFDPILFLRREGKWIKLRTICGSWKRLLNKYTLRSVVFLLMLLIPEAQRYRSFVMFFVLARLYIPNQIESIHLFIYLFVIIMFTYKMCWRKEILIKIE